MEKKEIILSGPKFAGKELVCSVAEFIIPIMKKQDEDHIIQVDSKTDEAITTRDFLKTSLGVAEGLIAFGLKEGEVVVLAAPNSIRCHAAALGIMFSGGVLTPINQNLKLMELQALLVQFRPKYIICESQERKKLEEAAQSALLDSKIILLDSNVRTDGFYCWNDITNNVDVDSYVPRKVSDPKTVPALICCSSGSTGLPKGVALSHFSIVYSNNILSSLPVEGLNESFLFTSPLFWISGIVLLLLACLTGKTFYIPKSLEVEDFMKGIEKYKPFSILLSPANLLFMVEHPSFKKYNMESVKMVAVGGSILADPIYRKVRAAWKNIILLQGYGLTEIGGSVIYSALTPENTIGKLGEEIKAKVVDVATGKTLGPHQVGELRLKAKTVMLGYYNNPEATKAAFDEDGWLRTGDLLYYDEEENFYVVGRIKEIIKYRNHQISPTEIESFIVCLPGVKDAAVVPIKENENEDTDSYYLKAVVVKNTKHDITAEDIIESVKRNFSEPKHLKGGVKFVDVLPRTETGKLRREEIKKLANLL